MRFAVLLAAALITGLSVSAEAADTKGKEKEAENLSYVSIAPVAVPVIVNGKVVNYVFVNVRIDLMPSANSMKLREREPFFRDALVRAAHRTPLSSGGGPPGVGRCSSGRNVADPERVDWRYSTAARACSKRSTSQVRARWSRA